MCYGYYILSQLLNGNFQLLRLLSYLEIKIWAFNDIVGKTKFGELFGNHAKKKKTQHTHFFLFFPFKIVLQTQQRGNGEKN